MPPCSPPLRDIQGIPAHIQVALCPHPVMRMVEAEPANQRLGIGIGHAMARDNGL